MDDRPERDATPERDPVMGFLDTWAWPYLEETTLWPVLFALLAHVVVLIALVLLHAWRAVGPFGYAGVILLGLLSFDLVRREVAERRRPGRLTLLVAVNWALGAVTAAFTGHWGLF